VSRRPWNGHWPPYEAKPDNAFTLPFMRNRDSDMDFWEFLARSEWPVVVAGGLYAFREPIKRKLESAVKASGFGMSVEFPEQQRLERNPFRLCRGLGVRRGHSRRP
jgi:hypothetical protein